MPRYRANFLSGVVSGLQNNASQTAITGTNFPTNIPAGSYLPVTLNPGYFGANNTSGPEVIYVSSVVGNVATVTRQQEGSTLASGTTVPWVAGPLVADFDVYNLTSTGTLTLSGTGGLTVSGYTNLSGTTVNGNLTVASGYTNLSGTTVNGNLTVASGITVTGSITVNNGLSVNGTNGITVNATNGMTIASGNLVVSGSVTVPGGSIYAGAVGYSGTNTQTGSYVVASGDVNYLIQMNNINPAILTLSGTFATGQQITAFRSNAGSVTISGASGVTIYSTGATSSKPIIRTPYSVATAIYLGSNNWLVTGDIS